MNKLWLFLLAGLAAASMTARAAGTAPLRLVETIPMPHVEGRIDHFSADAKARRLFVSALGNSTVEVFDLGAGRWIHSIPGLKEPQGVMVVPELDKIFVANAADGRCRIFDAASFKLIDTVDFSSDADNVRYDRQARRIYVGYGDGALGILDGISDKRLGDIKLEAHPESFQLEKSGSKIFVNVPDARQIVVIDRKNQTVLARWPVTVVRANFPMALDEAHHRVFVTCRRPAEVVVLDMASGKVVATVPCVGDADDMFYDSARRRIYVSGGEGFITVIEQQDADHYQSIAKIPTAPCARTSYFVPELNHLYLAVPHRGGQKAELRVYEAMP